MKKLLTAANTKLAVSLGISNAAATALMATLTLGLSAVITGLIVLWDKYSDAQEKPAGLLRKHRVRSFHNGCASFLLTLLYPHFTKMTRLWFLLLGMEFFTFL